MPSHAALEAQALQQQLTQDLEIRRLQGETLTPFLAPTTTKITHHFWGAAWSRHLETYTELTPRLPRGRTLLRQGKLLNLNISPGLVTASVADLYLFHVTIRIPPLPPETWAEIIAHCTGQVPTLLDLLTGHISDNVLKIITHPDHGLFPHRSEIRHHCTCLDDADLCAHQAALFYAIAVSFDTDPHLFFHLRHVDPTDLITATTATLTTPQPPTNLTLDHEDLSTLFGIQLTPGVDEAPAE